MEFRSILYLFSENAKKPLNMEAQNNMATERILVVDDEKEPADLIELYLKNDGYKNMNKISDFYEAEHIYLSKACDDDCEAMFNNIWSDEEISKYMNFKPISNFEDAKRVLRQSIEYQKNNMGFFVYLKENREAIGFAGIKRLSDDLYAESGLCIARKHQGKGYGKELLLLLQRIVFKELQGKKFVYACMRGNEKSKNLCLSLGYRYDCSETVVRKWDNYVYISDHYILSSEH